MKCEIKNRLSGEVQFTADIDCGEDEALSIKIGLAVKWALKTGAYLRGAYLRGAYLRGADLQDADLRGAYLRGADLRGADLRGADLIDGGQRADGYRFVGWVKDDILQIRAGCRDFTISEARKHWQEKRGGTPLGDETMLILDRIEGTAKIRGLIKGE